MYSTHLKSLRCCGAENVSTNNRFERIERLFNVYTHFRHFSSPFLLPFIMKKRKRKKNTHARRYDGEIINQRKRISHLCSALFYHNFICFRFSLLVFGRLQFQYCSSSHMYSTFTGSHFVCVK